MSYTINEDNTIQTCFEGFWLDGGIIEDGFIKSSCPYFDIETTPDIIRDMAGDWFVNITNNRFDGEVVDICFQTQQDFKANAFTWLNTTHTAPSYGWVIITDRCYGILNEDFGLIDSNTGWCQTCFQDDCINQTILLNDYQLIEGGVEYTTSIWAVNDTQKVHYMDWININHLFEKITRPNSDLYCLDSITLESLESRRLKIHYNTPNIPTGKINIFIKRDNDTFLTAIGHDRYCLSDPFWNTSWADRTCYDLNEGVGLDRIQQFVRINVTDLTLTYDCNQELRAVLDDEMISMQVIYDGSDKENGSKWCDIFILENWSADEEKELCVYHDNPNAENPSYTDRVDISQVHKDGADLINVTSVDSGTQLNFIYNGAAGEGGTLENSIGVVIGGVDVTSINYMVLGLQHYIDEDENDLQQTAYPSDVSAFGLDIDCEWLSNGSLGAVAHCDSSSGIGSWDNLYILIENEFIEFSVGGNASSEYQLIHQTTGSDKDTYYKDSTGAEQTLSASLYDDIGFDWVAERYDSKDYNYRIAFGKSGGLDVRTQPSVKGADWNFCIGRDMAGSGVNHAYMVNDSFIFNTFIRYESGDGTDHIQKAEDYYNQTIENPITAVYFTTSTTTTSLSVTTTISSVSYSFEGEDAREYSQAANDSEKALEFIELLSSESSDMIGDLIALAVLIAVAGLVCSFSNIWRNI